MKYSHTQNEGEKHDIDKTDWAILPWGALEEVVEVFKHGEAKYGRGNYQVVAGWRLRYLNAAMRHIIAYMKGETTDTESGKSHVAHACASLLMWLDNNQREG